MLSADPNPSFTQPVKIIFHSDIILQEFALVYFESTSFIDLGFVMRYNISIVKKFIPTPRKLSMNKNQF